MFQYSEHLLTFSSKGLILGFYLEDTSLLKSLLINFSPSTRQTVKLQGQ